MTNEQIEKAKNDYAQSIIDSFGRSGVPCGISDIRSMIADGFKAGATEALASQWVSVEDRLPEYNATCLVRGQEDNRHWWMHFAWFDGENFYDAQTDRLYRPMWWLPIPPLKGGDE